ncbi:MAG TPA: CoA-transferase [Syntrophales bacterium]|nr:CoA-transferase [Syntrophales bacterium]HPI56858.1 CoA-transferase [Syntrophales bacterium]HPN23444.1 CoA-transferase [Syntrophales bacterium]HQM28031.1 CoA-transferase [Syntrophales bacterium]
MENKATDQTVRMIVAISKILKNGEWVAAGTLSPVPVAGTLLAKHTHAPDITSIFFGDPADRMGEGLFELFGLVQKGKIDVFFLSGAQIDQQGNINLSVIGDYSKPKVRLPGGAGSNMLYAMAGRTILFTATHTKNLFVQKADFVNATAFDGGVKTPWRRGGLSHVVTPFGIMRFDTGINRIVLDSVFPGVSVDTVVENTGFDLGTGTRTIPTIEPVREEELRILKEVVSREMRPIYPLFTERLWGAA